MSQKIGAILVFALAIVGFVLAHFTTIRSPGTTDNTLASKSESVVAATVDHESTAQKTAPSPLPAGSEIQDSIPAALARFKDTARPLEERRQEIEDVARLGDEHSIKVLMALGDEKTYLNRIAVEALGTLSIDRRRPEVAEYLTRKLSDPDGRVVCAALRSLARQAGEGAVTGIVDTMERNRLRSDGHHEMLLCAAVDALELVQSAQAVPALVAELNRSGEKGWSLDYGSKVVAALGHLEVAEGRAAIVAYADRLSARLPPDSQARIHYQKKIDEARAFAR